jgi:hypothetical protein
MLDAFLNFLQLKEFSTLCQSEVLFIECYQICLHEAGEHCGHPVWGMSVGYPNSCIVGSDSTLGSVVCPYSFCHLYTESLHLADPSPRSPNRRRKRFPKLAENVSRNANAYSRI